MRKQLIVIVIGMVLLISAWVGTASAQDVPGYPVPGYPVETETPPENTPDPTQPPQPNPTEAPPTWVPTEAPPTWVPTEFSPTPSKTPVVNLSACPFSRVHPMLSIIVERYNISFEEVAEMFCSSHMGIGKIIFYLNSFQQPNGGLGTGNPGNMPENDGPGWGIFWGIFSPIGLHGNHFWAISR